MNVSTDDPASCLQEEDRKERQAHLQQPGESGRPSFLHH